jgi:hypothetical protein
LSHERGIVWLWWGDKAKTALDRSVQSVRDTNPDVPFYIVQLQGNPSWLHKPLMYELSPFKNTLFLDCDTVVLGDLNFGFQQAEKHGMALCINECPWARRYPCFTDNASAFDAVEYNSGVIFFNRSAGAVFRKWKQHAKTMDTSTAFEVDGHTLMQANSDQAALSFAMHELEANPFVLPLNWNFRYRWQRGFFGDVRIWHDYDPPIDYLTGNHVNKCMIVFTEQDKKECESILDKQGLKLCQESAISATA